jgi:hypothetical protein
LVLARTGGTRMPSSVLRVASLGIASLAQLEAPLRGQLDVAQPALSEEAAKLALRDDPKQRGRTVLPMTEPILNVDGPLFVSTPSLPALNARTKEVAKRRVRVRAARLTRPRVAARLAAAVKSVISNVAIAVSHTFRHGRGVVIGVHPESELYGGPPTACDSERASLPLNFVLHAAGRPPRWSEWPLLLPLPLPRLARRSLLSAGAFGGES